MDTNRKRNADDVECNLRGVSRWALARRVKQATTEDFDSLINEIQSDEQLPGISSNAVHTSENIVAEKEVEMGLNCSEISPLKVSYKYLLHTYTYTTYTTIQIYQWIANIKIASKEIEIPEIDCGVLDSERDVENADESVPFFF